MKRQGGKLLPCAVLTLCLAALGTGYAYWDGTLRVAGKLATGRLDCVFSTEGAYRAELMRESGEILAEVPLKTRAGDDEKSVELIFPEGLPDDFLGGENYIRISCPVDEKGMKAQTKEADLRAAEEEILLTPEQVYLALPDAVYDWDEPDAYFLEPYQLWAVRSVERVDDVLYCCLYLRAGERKTEGVMPDLIAVEEESLMDMPLSEHWFPTCGVWVSYSFATDLRIDQRSCEGRKRPSFFGPLTCYAYWTDQLKLKGTAALHFPVAVQLLEEGELPSEGAVIDDRAFASKSNAVKSGNTGKNRKLAGRTAGRTGDL